jgi:signal transduction histidine kinase
VTGLAKLLRTTAFRLAIIYFGLFAVAAAAAAGYIYYRTNILLAAQLQNDIQSELRSLAQHYEREGLDGLKRVINERSEVPGNSLYLIADAEGRRLSGNLKAVSEDLWNATGPVAFFYRRAVGDGVEKRFAFAVIFRLASGYRLVVGRDIEDQRQFGEIVRSAFMWTLIGMAVLVIGGGVIVGRSLLRRIDRMTDATQTIMAGDLSKRIPLTEAGDEFDRLAISINAMLKRIEELIAGLKEVSDNIAHDLKTPLSRLRNRAEAALRDQGDPKIHREALQETIEEADELIKTFDALLSIARLEAGAANRTEQRFDLRAVVNDVVELYEPVAEEQGLTLSLTAAGDTVVEGKRELIAQAVANLVDNAIKYGQAGGTQASLQSGGITVSVAPNSRFAEITVADRGPGIPTRDRERVLKRFVRLETSRSQPGSGLGLSLVAAVARLHGGSLVLSDNAPGLKATLMLPLPPESPDATG